MMNLTTSTALNIEHEVERFSLFVTIAIGEFLYKVVAPGNLGLDSVPNLLEVFSYWPMPIYYFGFTNMDQLPTRQFIRYVTVHGRLFCGYMLTLH